MVTLEHVSKDYYRGSIVIQALRDISVYIGEGEFCSLMGPSGSGKSTFLNVIAGLDTVTSGDVLLNGESTRGFSDAEWTKWRREWIGMVFQAFHLVPSLTAAENVGLPLLLNRMSAKLACERVNETLEMVGIEGRANHRPSELSGGEQQRVAIARAVVHRPRLLLADEPTGNLDSYNAAAIMELIRHVSKVTQQTVILATHSHSAAHIADLTYELHDGQLH